MLLPKFFGLTTFRSATNRVFLRDAGDQILDIIAAEFQARRADDQVAVKPWRTHCLPKIYTKYLHRRRARTEGRSGEEVSPLSCHHSVAGASCLVIIDTLLPSACRGRRIATAAICGSHSEYSSTRSCPNAPLSIINFHEPYAARSASLSSLRRRLTKQLWLLAETCQPCHISSRRMTGLLYRRCAPSEAEPAPDYYEGVISCMRCLHQAST